MFQEGFLPIPKIFQLHLTPFFNTVFHALLESVFIFFLSCLELEKLELKDLAILLLIYMHPYSLVVIQ